MTQKEIGESIKAKRQAMNMTQADLAAATGLFQASITMYESGRRRPSSAAAEVLAAALNRPKPAPVPPEMIAQTIDAYPRAETPAEKNALLKSILGHADYTKIERSRPRGPQTFALDLYPKLVQPDN